MLKLNLQLFAHKKGVGSSRNGRDSHSQRLGVKAYGGQAVRSGSIIIRQRGRKFVPGRNTALGTDDTIYATSDGVVRFDHVNSKNKRVSVIPVSVELN